MDLLAVAGWIRTHLAHLNGYKGSRLLVYPVWFHVKQDPAAGFLCFPRGGATPNGSLRSSRNSTSR